MIKYNLMAKKKYNLVSDSDMTIFKDNTLYEIDKFTSKYNSHEHLSNTLLNMELNLNNVDFYVSYKYNNSFYSLPVIYNSPELSEILSNMDGNEISVLDFYSIFNKFVDLMFDLNFDKKIEISGCFNSKVKLLINKYRILYKESLNLEDQMARDDIEAKFRKEFRNYKSFRNLIWFVNCYNDISIKEDINKKLALENNNLEEFISSYNTKDDHDEFLDEEEISRAYNLDYEKRR